MTISDWAIVFATLAGPVLAVQAQKKLEVHRSRREVKNQVFQALMSTRGSQLSEAHVQALNTIDLAFYGRGPGRRSLTEAAVIGAWREYHDHLGARYGEFTQVQKEHWHTRRGELLLSLLEAMAKDCRYDFDRVSLDKGGYTPIAHETIQLQQLEFRTLVIDLLRGDRFLPMALKEVQQAENAQQWNDDVLSALRDIRDGNRPMTNPSSQGRSPPSA